MAGAGFDAVLVKEGGHGCDLGAEFVPLRLLRPVAASGYTEG